MSTTPTTPAPTPEMLARAWHALSDEGFEGVPFDGEGCKCRVLGPLLRQVLDLVSGDSPSEPEGLGAVAVNPFTDGAGIGVSAAWRRGWSLACEVPPVRRGPDSPGMQAPPGP